MKLLHSKLYNADLKLAIKKIENDPLQGKTILITGGLGLICSTIVDLLVVLNKEQSTNIKVVVGARYRDRFLTRYGDEDVEFLQYDAQENFGCTFAPDYIIHGAGLASPELYTQKPVETILSNFLGIESLLKFSLNNGVKRVLYISSSEVYGIKATEDPFSEGEYGLVDLDKIRSSYPIAKRASEMLCKAYSLEYGVQTIIVRPGHVYGPSASIFDHRISSEFSYKAAKGENLEMKSCGIQERSYCYAIDAAVAILTALTKGKSGEAYNIGHNQSISIRYMAQIVAKAGNVNLKLVEPTENELITFNPMNNAALDNEKIKKLGYKDTFTVEEGLTHTVRILQEIM